MPTPCAPASHQRLPSWTGMMGVRPSRPRPIPVRSVSLPGGGVPSRSRLTDTHTELHGDASAGICHGTMQDRPARNPVFCLDTVVPRPPLASCAW
jgi:hypothetical protein